MANHTKDSLSEHEPDPVKGLSCGEILRVPFMPFRLLFKTDAPVSFSMIHEPDQPDQVLNQIPEIKQHAKQLFLLFPVDELMVSEGRIIPDLLRTVKNA
jgi:hypothetical protein